MDLYTRVLVTHERAKSMYFAFFNGGETNGLLCLFLGRGRVGISSSTRARESGTGMIPVGGR